MTLAPKCDCGHGLVRHPTRGACTRCACTWYHPNVSAIKAKPRKPLAPRGATKAKKEARYKAYLKSAAWKLLRVSALDRAKHRCEAESVVLPWLGALPVIVRCPSTERLAVHHLTYARFGCELAQDLRVLCKSCHDRLHALEGKRIA